MTYALISDLPISWPTYEQVAATALTEIPDGLVLHVAGPTDEGVRVIDVWETENAFRAFERERLAPALDSRQPIEVPAPLRRELEVRHLVAGRAGA